MAAVVARGGSLAAGLFTIAVGAIHIAGVPPLRWSEGSFVADVNAGWRNVFTLEPNALFANWTPVVLGLVTISAHLTKSPPLVGIWLNWLRVCLWFVFLALFANFGFAGSIGVIVGFFSVLVAFLAAIVFFTQPSAATRFEISVGSPCTCCTRQGGIGLGKITAFFCMLNALFVLAVGIVSVIDRLPAPCNPDVAECVGPGLFWNSDDLIEDINIVWRTFFTLAPSIFIVNFTPFILGFVCFVIQFSTRALLWMDSSWLRVLFWHLLVGVLVAGYAGNLGVLTFGLCGLIMLLSFLLFLFDVSADHTRLGIDFVGHVQDYSQRG